MPILIGVKERSAGGQRGFAQETPRAFWNSKGGGRQFTRPLPVDLQGAGAFIWKSNPYEVVQEEEGDPRTVYAGADFLAAYWPMRRLGILGPGE